MCELIDIAEAVRLCNGLGNDNLVLLQCGSLYPLPPEQANLRVLESFRSSFGTALGFSDHTLGNAAAAAAVALGARVFEKHFTLDRSMKGPDHSYALEPAELKAYVQTVSEIGRASCRGRVCQLVSISVVDGSLKNKTLNRKQELRK